MQLQQSGRLASKLLTADFTKHSLSVSCPTVELHTSLPSILATRSTRLVAQVDMEGKLFLLRYPRLLVRFSYIVYSLSILSVPFS